MKDRSLSTEQYKINAEPQGKLWIVHVMQVLGVWEKFRTWMDKIYYDIAGAMVGEDFDLPGYIIDFFIEHERDNILTDGKLLVLAVEAWLKEREG